MKGKPITLQEAHNMALQIQRDTDERLMEERKREAERDTDPELTAANARIAELEARLAEADGILNSTAEARDTATRLLQAAQTANFDKWEQANQRAEAAEARAEALRDVAAALAVIAQGIEEHYGEECLYCGYGDHKSTCSLNAALGAWQAVMNFERAPAASARMAKLRAALEAVLAEQKFEMSQWTNETRVKVIQAMRPAEQPEESEEGSEQKD